MIELRITDEAVAIGNVVLNHGQARRLLIELFRVFVLHRPPRSMRLAPQTPAD